MRLIFLSTILLFTSVVLSGQAGLVVNEVSQGTCCARDYVELIVVGDSCETVDLRHWVIDDNNGDFVECAGAGNGAIRNVGITNGHVRFTDDDIWSAVPVGTIILIYSWDPNSPDLQADIDGLEIDYTDENCDMVRVLPLNASNIYMERSTDFPSEPSTSDCPASLTCPNGGDGNPGYTGATYLPLTNRSFDAARGEIGFNISADACQVRRPDYSYFHGVSWGQTIMDCIAGPPLDGGPDQLHITDIGSTGRVYYLRNTNDTDYRDNSNFTVGMALLRQTPGRPNSCDNANWIASIRRPELDDKIFGKRCENPIIDTTFCLGDTINLLENIETGQACQADNYTWGFNDINSLISVVDITDSTSIVTTLAEGMTVIEVIIRMDHDDLYQGLNCDDIAPPSELMVTYHVTIQNPDGITLDTNAISTCAGVAGMGNFFLPDYISTIKAGASSATFYSDADAMTVLPDLYESPGGESIYVIIEQYGCASLPLELELVVDGLPETNLQLSVCPQDSLVIGGIVWNQDNPRGSVVVPAQNATACDTLVNVDLSFDGEKEQLIQELLCPNQFRIIEGVRYNQDNPTGRVTLDIPARGGCDSVIVIDLSFIPVDTTWISPVLCPDEERMIAGEIYDINRPSGFQRLLGAATNGCDSVIAISLQYLDYGTYEVIDTICAGDSLMVNGIWYSESRPDGRDTFPHAAANGCDSMNIISLSFKEPIRDTLSRTLCAGGELRVGTEIFDESNPQGEVLLTSQQAPFCDSILWVQLSFQDAGTATYDGPICDGDTIVIAGTSYHADHLTGRDTARGASVNGCDSISIINLRLLQPSITQMITTLCDGEHVMVLGERYDATNPIGTETLEGGAVDGCDSIVEVDLSFQPPHINFITDNLCANDTVNYLGTDYHAGRLTGRDTISGGAASGCDSILDIDLQLLPVPAGSLQVDICEGDSLLVHGTWYSERNTSGEHLLDDAASNGCDSSLQVIATILSKARTSIADAICPGDSILVNGNYYSHQRARGTEILLNGAANGCDSIITIELELLDKRLETISGDIPLLDTVYVAGTAYHRTRRSDVITLPGAASNGCDSIITVDLNFVGLDITARADSPLCVDELGSITIEDISTDLYPVTMRISPDPHTILLSGPEDLPFTFSDLTADTYEILFTDAGGFNGIYESTITESPDLFFEAESELTLYYGEQEQLDIQTNAEIDMVRWSPGFALDCDDCLSPLLDPKASQLYLVQALDANGCEYSLEIDVTVLLEKDFFLPNVFSPNGDGVNDIFTIQAGPRVTQLKTFQVYNRVGALIHAEADGLIDEMAGWDGFSHGQQAAIGVYVYIAEVILADGSISRLSGDVTIVR